MTNWTVKDIPSQAGRLAIVTGANSGIGYETAKELARAGAEVILAGRSEEKNQAAIALIREAIPAAKVRFGAVDLSSLESVRGFAETRLAEGRPVDLLINNAGVMAPPKRRTSADGFELQFATNHLGHFALTGRLLPLLSNARQPRVVNVASLAHRQGTIRFDDLQSEKRYVPFLAYGQSKLANLLFSLELEKRSETRGWGLMAVTAAPGWARTELITNGPGMAGWMSISKIFAPFFSHSAGEGALPTLFAATADVVKPNGYYEPRDLMHLKGPVMESEPMPKARDEEVARRLWEVSEKLSGVKWPG